QLEHVGVQSLTITNVTLLFTGMVLAVQTAYSLSSYGGQSFVGDLLALSIVRELGPVLTALMVAGRVGAGITAELGSMAVTALADVVGLFGGLVMAVSEVGQSRAYFVSHVVLALRIQDITSGVGKSVFFALFIGIIACYNGLAATGGADGVGKATTNTVVTASIAIIIADFFLTKIFLVF